MIRHSGRTSSRIDLTIINRHLRLAQRHVEEAAGEVSMQRQAVERLPVRGVRIKVARMLLNAFEAQLEMQIAIRDRLARLRDEAEVKRGSFLTQRWL
jgi:hypothetical protein